MDPLDPALTRTAYLFPFWLRVSQHAAGLPGLGGGPLALVEAQVGLKVLYRRNIFGTHEDKGARNAGDRQSESFAGPTVRDLRSRAYSISSTVTPVSSVWSPPPLKRPLTGLTSKKSRPRATTIWPAPAKQAFVGS